MSDSAPPSPARKSRWWIWLLLGLLSLGAIVAGWQWFFPSKPEPPTLDVQLEGEPALLKVTGNGADRPGTAYLFGTVHVLPKDVQWRSPALTAAMAASDRLVIEVTGLEDTSKTAKIFARLGLSRKLPPVRKRVEPDLRDEFDELLDLGSVPEFALNQMESWSAALTLGASQAQALGLDPELGVEKKLIADFKGRPIVGLETIEKQLGYFDRLPEKQQRTMLNRVVADADKAKQSFEELFNAWIAGDDEALGKLADDSFLTEPQLREQLLVARNRDWTDQIEAMLGDRETLFIAVGAAHLAGADSVQTMLEKRGFKIERVQ